MIATSAVYPAFCASCTRTAAEGAGAIEPTDIDGRTFLIGECCLAEPADPGVPMLLTPRGQQRMAGRTLRVYEALRDAGPSNTATLAGLLGVDPTDAKVRNTLHAATSRLRRRGLVDVISDDATRGRNGVIYRLARGR